MLCAAAGAAIPITAAAAAIAKSLLMFIPFGVTRPCSSNSARRISFQASDFREMFEMRTERALGYGLKAGVRAPNGGSPNWAKRGGLS